MPARKSTKAKTEKSAARAKSVPATRARASANGTKSILARLQKPIKETLAEARESSHELALAGLGLVSTMHKQRETRMAQMVAEGRRVEPKVKKAVVEFKDKLQSRLDVKNLKLPKLNFDAAEIRRRLEEGIADTQRRFAELRN